MIDVTLLRKQMLELMKRPDISEQLMQKYLKKVIIHIQSTDVRPEITGWYPDIDAYFSETKSDVYDDTELLELPDHGGILRFAK